MFLPGEPVEPGELRSNSVINQNHDFYDYGKQPPLEQARSASSQTRSIRKELVPVMVGYDVQQQKSPELPVRSALSGPAGVNSGPNTMSRGGR